MCCCPKFISNTNQLRNNTKVIPLLVTCSFLEDENHSALYLLPHLAHCWCWNFFLMNEVYKSLLCCPSIVPLSKEVLSKYVSNFLCCQKYCLIILLKIKTSRADWTKFSKPLDALSSLGHSAVQLEMDHGERAAALPQIPRNVGYVRKCLENASEAERIFPKQYTHKDIWTREYALENRCMNASIEYQVFTRFRSCSPLPWIQELR